MDKAVKLLQKVISSMETSQAALSFETTVGVVQCNKLFLWLSLFVGGRDKDGDDDDDGVVFRLLMRQELQLLDSSCVITATTSTGQDFLDFGKEPFI
jgi:hypothetical protein